MLTVNNYPDAKDGDGLAQMANAVLESYKSAGAVVIRTSSIPRTSTREAEHFIAVMFERPNFAEAAFAKFRIREGKGSSLVYSHRTYGKTAGTLLRKWLTANGEKREKAINGLVQWPSK
jgi:hypothetical protein